MPREYALPTYPVLEFIARWGTKIVAFSGVALSICGIVAAYLTGFWFIAPFTIVCAVLVGGLLTSYVEIVRIVLDTLVPR